MVRLKDMAYMHGASMVASYALGVYEPCLAYPFELQRPARILVIKPIEGDVRRIFDVLFGNLHEGGLIEKSKVVLRYSEDRLPYMADVVNQFGPGRSQIDFVREVAKAGEWLEHRRYDLVWIPLLIGVERSMGWSIQVKEHLGERVFLINDVENFYG